MIRDEPLAVKPVDWDQIQRQSCIHPQPLPLDRPYSKYNDKQWDTTCSGKRNSPNNLANQKCPITKKPCSGTSSRAGGVRSARVKPFVMKSYPTKRENSTDGLIEIERDFVTALRNAEMIAWNNEMQKEKLAVKKLERQQERNFGERLAMEQSKWIADETVRAQWVKRRNQLHVADVAMQMKEKAADKKLKIERELAKAADYRKAVEIEDIRIKEETSRKTAEQKKQIHDILTQEIQDKKARKAIEKEKEMVELQMNRLYNDHNHRKENLLSEMLNKNHFNNSFLNQHHKRLQEINTSKQLEYQAVMSDMVEHYQRVKAMEDNLLERQIEKPKNCAEYLTDNDINDNTDLAKVLKDAEMARNIAIEEADERRRKMQTGEQGCLKNNVDGICHKLQKEREVFDELKQNQFMEYANRSIKVSEVTSSPTYPIERFIEKYINEKIYQPSDNTISRRHRNFTDCYMVNPIPGTRSRKACVLPGIIPSGRAETTGWYNANRGHYRR